MGPSSIPVPKGDAGRPHPSRGWQHPGAGLTTLRHAETGIIHGISVCIGPCTSWHCYRSSGALVCSFCRSTNKPPQAAVTAHRYSSMPLALGFIFFETDSMHVQYSNKSITEPKLLKMKDIGCFNPQYNISCQTDKAVWGCFSSRPENCRNSGEQSSKEGSGSMGSSPWHKGCSGHRDAPRAPSCTSGSVPPERREGCPYKWDATKQGVITRCFLKTMSNLPFACLHILVINNLLNAVLRGKLGLSCL